MEDITLSGWSLSQHSQGRLIYRILRSVSLANVGSLYQIFVGIRMRHRANKTAAEDAAAKQ
ncbi:hypothetical protein [Paramixta manurensis]|uniref:hypothetical protein n=1 Tax=Paramixta manurensis TaxID=2740817 RepID=UPI00156B2E18